MPKNQQTANRANRLRLGTRASALARWQADWVTARLAELDVIVEQVLITTGGDVSREPITQVGGQGLFTKEIQRALLDGEIDLAVHSLKDLPTEPVPGLDLAAVPVRESTKDALIASGDVTLADLPPGSRIGTGSRRRQSQLLHVRPDLVMLDIRGNVDTRLAKLDQGEYDAIVLAEAGLKRLQLDARISQLLEPPLMLPAIGQGALGLEIRADDDATRGALSPLNDPDTWAAVVAERALLAALRGGCLAPIGAWGRVADSELRLDAVVLSPDGQQRITAAGAAAVGDATSLGRQLATELLQQGATELIAAARN